MSDRGMKALRTALLVLGVASASSCDEDGGPIQPLCTVTVVSPNGGESWTQGSEQEITWTSSGGCGSDVTIQLLRNGTVRATIAESEPDDGEYVWTVSRGDPEADGYSIRVLNPAGGASDAGDAPFTIPDLCVLAVTSPAAGESWLAGTSHAIAWSTVGECGSDVKIELLRDGAVCSTIAASEPNDGEYDWTAAGCGGFADGYAVRVTDLTSAASGASDGAFSIATPCAISVTAPLDGETLVEGSVRAIAWTRSGACGDSVRIELLREGAVCLTVAASEADDGYYPWTVARCAGGEDGYAIRVTDLEGGSSGASAGTFRIRDACSIALVSPNGAESWVEGTAHTIVWTTSGACGSNVRIELVRNGAVCATIAASEAGDGEYAWTAVPCGDAADGYTVRVTDAATGATDESDAVFAIPPSCALAVTAPQGGESWIEGTGRTIAWTSSGVCGPDVTIELLRNGAVCRTIAGAEPNDGLYTWVAAQNLDYSDGYSIRVTDPTSGASGTSAGVFTIPDACLVAVTAPNRDESWTEGSSHAITWNASGACGASVKIELLRNGSVCSSIASSAPNSGEYPWTVARCGGSTNGFTVRVTDLATAASDASDGAFEIPAACAVTVTSPNGGQMWSEGSSRAITWSPLGVCGSSVKIELLRNGSVCRTIAASEPNDGEYAWTVARCGSFTDGYTVRVTDLTTGATDQSNSSFTIPESCAITVTDPDGGEAWTEGNSRLITWTATGACGSYVKIELLRNGTVCRTIAASEPNDGEYTWAVAQCGDFTDAYTVRVTDLTSGASDASNGPFTIPNLCTVAVAAPNGGEAWTDGSSRSIQWTSSGICGPSVRIELLRNGEVCATVAASTANDGQHTWIAAPCGGAADGYAIRVTDLTSGASDESDGAFTIPGVCVPVVTSPNGGESWTAGTSRSITWITSGTCGASVKIELLRNGSVCAVIAAAEPNDGEFAWTAAQCGGFTEGYTVRVTDSAGGALDVSNAPFTIPSPCAVTVTAPNGGESWTEGSSQSIAWAASGACGASVRIELLRSGSVCSTIAASTPNDGQYSWPAAQCSDLTDGYTIRVTDLATGAADGSDTSFTIPNACAVTVTAPNGGESWTEGSGQSVVWTTSGACGANVKIELLRNGAVCSTIAASTPNDGQYSWPAAQCGDFTDSYAIRVTDLASGAADVSDAPFGIPNVCTVAVTAPNGGESWTEGSSRTIAWSTTGACGGNVKIELLRNGAVCATLAASEPNDGAYDWVAEQCAGSTNGYSVRVTDLSTGASDASAGPFTIPDACAVTVTAPNGGESWTEGSSHTITWASSVACGANVKLELLQGGSVCAILAASEPNDGQFTWNAAQCADLTEGYAIRVTDLVSGAFDDGDASFSIPGACALSLAAPNGGETWVEGSGYSILWTPSGACGSTVKIELLRGGALCSTIAASEANDGVFVWIAARCGGQNAGYAIRVTDLASGATDVSATPFTILEACAVQVTSPDGGETWVEGSSRSILWTSSAACGANVKIELLRNGVLCSTIAASETNDGSHPWTAARCGGFEDGYTVRVTDLSSGATDLSATAFTIPEACAVQVTSPDGGETWVEGSAQTITWTPTGFCGANVKIELLRNGVLCSTIAASETNDGSHPWTAARCGSFEDGYTVRVTDLSSGATDVSATAFTIPEACAVQVTSPDGGETWVEGSAQTITWTPTGFCGANVKIELLRNGAVCSTIAASETNDGSHPWTAARCGSFEDGYTVRVTDLSSGATDVSAAPFTIPEACAVQVMSPDGGETWVEGSAQTITWTPTGFCGANVKIELLRNGAVCSTIAASETNDGSHPWTAAQCADSTSGYAIQVTDLSSGAADTSDAAFTIPGCTLAVAVPNGGEAWTAGQDYEISWGGSPGTNVRIELLENGVWCADVAASTPNDGTFIWTAAQCAGATGYSIRIVDLDYNCEDSSDAGFTVDLP